MDAQSDLEARFTLAEAVEGEPAGQPDLFLCVDCGATVRLRSHEQHGMPLCPKCYTWRVTLVTSAATRGFVTG